MSASDAFDLIHKEKAALRLTQRGLLRACSPQSFHRAGLELLAYSDTFLEGLKPSSHVALYNAMPHELSLEHVHHVLVQAGHTPCYPRVDVLYRHMTFVPSQEPPTIPGAYGILEPQGPALHPDLIDAVCVPGLAFDHTGRRMGQGGGFYDRWIQAREASMRPLWLIGVGLALQVVDAVPTHPHDHRVDALWTPQGFISCE